MAAANRTSISQAIAILKQGRDLTLATLWPDGAPHAVTVSYVSEGLDIYFGCSPSSQKAKNLDADDRVAITVNLDYQTWDEIRGLSLSGRARRLLDVREIEYAATMFAHKFKDLAQYVASSSEELALFCVRPSFINVLDYRKGFGCVEAIPRSDLTRSLKISMPLRTK